MRLQEQHADPHADNANIGRQSGPITVAYFFDHLATEEDTEVTVEAQDFEAAHKELVPSVSAKELEHYERVRAVFERVEDAKKDAEHNGKSSAGRTVNGNAADDDDDYVLRTSNLSLGDDRNGGWAHDSAPSTPPMPGSKMRSNGVVAKGQGKGKGKAIDNAGNDFGFGSVTDDDAGMYDQ